MFSEYASRFLAQSQSRLSLSQNDPSNGPNSPERQRGGLARGPTRGYLQRRPHGNPYAGSGGTASQTSRFPFATRASQSQAPLFYSATDEFREEDDGQEHEREAADFYALQQSRRDFGAGHLSDSSDSERGNEGGIWGPGGNASAGPRGIRSSWTGDEQDDGRPTPTQSQKQPPEESTAGFGSMLGRGKDRLVDVELASTIHEADELEAGQSRSADTNPPSIQHMKKPQSEQPSYRDVDLDQSETAPFLQQQMRRESTMDEESVPALADSPNFRQDVYDSFWGSLFIIDIVALFSTFLLIVLHTSAPGKSSKLGDTIYSTMTSSFYLLAVDTLVAVIVALVWIAALRSFVKPLVYLMLAAVPIVAISFSLYPFISSFGGSWKGNSIQDQVMRWASLVPGAFAIIWVYTAYKGRGSLEKAINLLEFTTRIVAACPTLIAVGFATLGAIVCWTWVWMLMFTRVFLGGHKGTAGLLFIIDTSTWWLGAYFFLTYLWSLGVLSGVQRATTAATTSQWYFYRNAVPAPPPHSVVRAAFLHATIKVFGTICLSTLLALAVRLPLLVLPARLSGYLSLCFYSFVPASVTTLTNPLTLTYAAIHSQPLGMAARGLSELTFVAPTGTTATTALTPGAFSSPHRAASGTPSLVAYRLAKLLLHATRLITSMAFGFGGWVSTARGVADGAGGMRGSLYAYVVGLIAGAIGWAVLGAAEGILSGVLDAVVICWGSEMQSHGNGQARFCREAGELLADDGRVGL